MTSTNIPYLRDTYDNFLLIQEGESWDLTGHLEDTDGNQLEKASITDLELTLYNESDNTVINSRNSQDVLDNNGGSMVTDGSFTIKLQPLDNIIVDTVNVLADQTETHLIKLVWKWNDGIERTGITLYRFKVQRLDTVA